MRTLAVSTLILLLTACGPFAENTQAAGEGFKTISHDTQDSWRNAFAYHPRGKEQLPQTRYCYQMQSDIVCYDSPQSGLTAKLIGYQDGASISWVQPGGGSLGVSGGEPTAPYDAQRVQVAPTVTGTATVINTAPPMGSAPLDTVTTNDSVTVTDTPVNGGPFYTKESPYVKSAN